MKLSTTIKLGFVFVLLCLVVLLVMSVHTPHTPIVEDNDKEIPLENFEVGVIDTPVVDIQDRPHIELLDWTWDETDYGTITISGRFKNISNGHLHGVEIAPVLFNGIRRLDPHHKSILFGKHRIDYRIEVDRVIPFDFRIHMNDYGSTIDTQDIKISLVFSAKPSMYDDPIKLKLK